MKKACRPLPCSPAALAVALVAAAASWGQGLNITSAPNVVGSGARALGMGGAFIAVADDATAASWNPGGLVQLERPEFSAVYDFAWFNEDFSSGLYPGLGGDQEISLNGLNYLSAVYPLPWTLGGRNFVVSLNYQRKWDFDRKLKLRYSRHSANVLGGIQNYFSNFDYEQEGQLAALSPAFGFEITDTLSAGVVLNIWNESILPGNEWTITSRERSSTLLNGILFPGNLVGYRQKEYYNNFKGVNLTLGMLYKPDDRWSFGVVYHTRFTGDVDYKRTVGVRSGGVLGRIVTDDREKEITFPSAVGAGAAYRFPNDKLTVSLDVTRRSWNQFMIHDPGNRRISQRKLSGVTGLPDDDHDVDATWTVRAGAEYVFVDDGKPIQKYLPSVRFGVFYDPEPASNRPDTFWGLGRGDGKPDKYYGITLGAGVLIMDRVNVDLAYVYRWGDGVRQDTFGFPETDADVGQHALYLSTVVYF